MDLPAASIPERALPIEKELGKVSRWTLRQLLRWLETKQPRLQKRCLCRCDACFDRRGGRGDAVFSDLEQRRMLRRQCFLPARRSRSECAGSGGGLLRAVALRCLAGYPGRFRMKVRFRANHRWKSKLQRQGHFRALGRPGLFRRSPEQEHQGGPMQPGLWSSIGSGGIAPPLPYTNAPPQHARRLSPASVPVRMPPWRRGSVRKVRPTLPPHRYLLSPCGCAPEFAASLPLPSIVTATRPRGQKPQPAITYNSAAHFGSALRGRRLKFR